MKKLLLFLLLASSVFASPADPTLKKKTIIDRYYPAQSFNWRVWFFPYWP